MATIPLPPLLFSLDTSVMDALLNELISQGEIMAIITNDAQSEDGFYYWDAVNNGRGPVYPVKAHTLHWTDARTGAEVFSKHAGPTNPQHMRERALPVISERAQMVDSFWFSSRPFSRASVVEFVNTVAEIAVEEMQQRTTIRSGELARSYRIKKAT